MKGLKALTKFYGVESLISGYIASRTAHPYPLSENVLVVPGSEIDRYLTQGEEYNSES